MTYLWLYILACTMFTGGFLLAAVFRVGGAGER